MYSLTRWKLNQDEMIGLIVVIVVLIIVFAACLFHILHSDPHVEKFKMSSFGPPAWILISMLAITLILMGCGGFILYSKPGMKGYFALWVISLVILWSSYAVFFRYGLTGETGYLLLFFLAAHIFLSYQISTHNKIIALLNMAVAAWYIYLTAVVADTTRLNA